MHATLGSTDPTAKALPRRHAVVVGGGMAGMPATHVLADHFEQVTLLERDHLPETGYRPDCCRNILLNDATPVSVVIHDIK